MSTKVPKQRTYWIADIVTPACRELALLLSQKGYEVSFFTSLEELVQELTSKRAGVLIVSDDFGDQLTERILLSLMTMPEVQGIRAVMVRLGRSDAISNLAACANFRDILPADMAPEQWVTRFIYATGGQPVPYVQPTGQVTLNNISAANLPARLTWISSSRLRLECRVRPPLGAALSLRGPLAAAAGISTISLTVVETQRSHLLYRFSDGIVAEWKVPVSSRHKVLKALEDVYRQDPGPRCRVFIAVQTPALRAEALLLFEEPRFEISTSLRKQSIVEAPRYFTPDLVIIEASLCREEGGQRFAQMMTNLSEAVTVVVVGELPDFDMVQKAWPDQRVVQFAKLPPNLPQSIVNRYMPARQSQREGADKTGANILPEHAFSRGEITFPARLHRIHAQAVQIAVPFAIGNFALCRLDSPLLHKVLGRSPYVKITATYLDTHPTAATFAQLAEGYLADLSISEQHALARALIQLVTSSLNRFDQRPGLASSSTGDSRTPELGSVRAEASLDYTGGDPVARPAGVPSVVGNTALAASALPEDLTLAEAIAEGQKALKLAPAPEVLAPARLDRDDDDNYTKPKPVRLVPDIEVAMIIKAVALAIAVGAIFFGIFSMAANRVGKSGSNYSNQLEKFGQPRP